MRSRTGGMWWGLAIETPDPAALGAFYAALMEWPVVHEEPGTTVLAAAQSPSGSTFVVFQEAPGYVAPTWPPATGDQRPMSHLDVQVGDLDAAQAEATALGARLAAHQPNPGVRVMLDPAGHPFCLCLDEE